MTLNVETPITTFVGDGVTTLFAFPWTVPVVGEVEAQVNGTTVSISLFSTNSPAPGGSVTLTTAPAASAVVRIARNTALSQSTAYPIGGSFSSAAHEAALDKLTRIVQEGDIGDGNLVTYENLALNGDIGDGANQVPDGASVQADIAVVQADINGHQAAPNPHGISAATVGLGNVNNTSDANKPVSTAQQAEIDTKADAGANSDITSLAGLTTELSVSQGGTGQSTEQAAIDALSAVSAAAAGEVLTKVGASAQWSAPFVSSIIRQVLPLGELLPANTTIPIASSLTLPLSSNTTYRISGILRFLDNHVASIGGINVKMNFTMSTALIVLVDALAVTYTDTAGLRQFLSNLRPGVDFDSNSNSLITFDAESVLIDGIFRTGAGSVMTINWAQTTASVREVFCQVGSFIQAEVIG